jgi:hypothetical protein
MYILSSKHGMTIMEINFARESLPTCCLKNTRDRGWFRLGPRNGGPQRRSYCHGTANRHIDTDIAYVFLGLRIFENETLLDGTNVLAVSINQSEAVRVIEFRSEKVMSSEGRRTHSGYEYGLAS